MPNANKEIVEKINAAFAENRPEDFLSFCDENVEWTMIGDKTYEGKSAIREFMSSMEDMEPPKFTVDEIIDGGDSVACYGDMTMKDKDGSEDEYSYCDIYGFAGGKVRSLRSFIVKHKTEGELGQQKATA